MQRVAVDTIKHNALTRSVRSRRAQAHILTEYVWAEEGAESTALERVGDSGLPWLAKLVDRQLADERRHAMLFRTRLAELGVAHASPPPGLMRAKLWWLDRACAPYHDAFAAGSIVVLLAVAAQLEATGVRMFSRHLGVLEALVPDDPTTAILRSVVADEKRHARSCAAAAERLVRSDERAAYDALRDAIARIDRAFGITISLGMWVVVAAAWLRDGAPTAPFTASTTFATQSEAA